jgi:hypothetical protein
MAVGYTVKLRTRIATTGLQWFNINYFNKANYFSLMIQMQEFRDSIVKLSVFKNQNRLVKHQILRYKNWGMEVPSLLDFVEWYLY